MNEAVEKLAHNSIIMLLGRFAIGILVVIAGMILREMWTMRDTWRDEIIALKAQFSVVNIKLDAAQNLISTITSDRYTAGEAARDFRYLQVQIDDIKRRQDERTVQVQVPVHVPAPVRTQAPAPIPRPPR